MVRGLSGYGRGGDGGEIEEGRTAEIVDELMATLKFDQHVFRPATVSDAAVPAEE